MISDEFPSERKHSTPPQRPRLLVVLAANVFGGAEVQTHALLSTLCPEFTVTLVTHARIATRFRTLPLTLVEFEDFGLTSPYYYGWRNVMAYGKAVSRITEACRAEVVYGVMHNSSLFVAAARWLHPWRMSQTTVIGSLHGSFRGCFEQRKAAATLVESTAIRSVLRSLNAIVTPSRGVANELTQLFGARPDSVHPIYNGFNLENIRKMAQQPLPVPKNFPWILTCCRLNDQKDFKTLITAFSLAKCRATTQLIIVGEGPERDMIEGLVREHNLIGQVMLPGFQSNPFPWIGAADAFVLSSFYEGFGNVIVEAFALGVPVVSSNCPWGPDEIIEPGISGYLFPPGDSAACAAHIDRLLADANLCKQIGQAALRRSEHFSQQRMADQYSELFHTAIFHSSAASGKSMAPQ